MILQKLRDVQQERKETIFCKYSQFFTSIIEYLWVSSGIWQDQPVSHSNSWCHSVSCSIIEYLWVSSGIWQDWPMSNGNDWYHTVSCSIIEYLWVADRIKISKLTIFGTNYTSDSNSLVICNSSAASHHQMKLRIFKAHWSQLRKTYVSWYLHLCSSKINFQGKATWYGTIQTRHILINIRILSYELNALLSTERGCVSCLKHILVV